MEYIKEGSGWGTRVYLWQIHVDIWQNQYNIVKLIKKKQQQKKNTKIIESSYKRKCTSSDSCGHWRQEQTGI